TRFARDWSSDVCSSDLPDPVERLKVTIRWCVHVHERLIEVRASRLRIRRHHIRPERRHTKHHARLGQLLPLPDLVAVRVLAYVRSEERRVGEAYGTVWA